MKNLENNYFYKQPICQTTQCNLLTLYMKKKYGFEVTFIYNSHPVFKNAVQKAIKYLNNENNTPNFTSTIS